MHINKLLGSTLALAMLFPAGQANAEMMKNLKFSGMLDVQTTSARNVTDFVTRPGTPQTAGAVANNNDRIGAATTRLMVTADWDVLDDVHARATVVKGASNHAARAYGSASQDLNGIQTASFVEEANVKIDKIFGGVDTTIGRQFYGEQGDLVIYYGPRDNYGLTVNALDAFRADWNGEHMMITGVAGKTAGGANTPNTSAVPVADTDLRGIIVSCKMHENFKPSAYIYNSVAHGTGGLGITAGSAGTTATRFGKNTNLWVAGLKAKFMMGGLWGNAEYAKNYGSDRTTYAGTATGAQNVSFKGWAFLTKLGYKAELDGIAAVSPWGEFGIGTGDSNFDYAGNRNFQSINTDYRPGGIYGRFDANAATALGQAVNGTIASNGLTNRVIWGAGIKATPAAANKLTAGLQYYRYAFHRVAPGATGLKTSRNIGSEVDVTAQWMHSDNVSFKATAGTFLPGAFVADVQNAAGNGAHNPAVMLAGDVSIKF